MRKELRYIIIGQALLIACCVFYLIWWYRGFRPGVNVNRVGGMNGILLLITAVLGITGIVFSLMPGDYEMLPERLNPVYIIAAGVILYIVLLLITKYFFRRIVTSELFLIVMWTMLETEVINRLKAAGFVPGAGFLIVCLAVAAAFTISIVLYVAYYRMEEMKAFYAAMVPLVTEAAAMGVLILAVLW